MLIQKIFAWFLVIRLFFAAGFFIPGSGGRAEAIAKDETAAAGYSLTQTLLKKCYSTVKHEMYNNTDGKDRPYVWAAASFLEAMSDAYRLFPNDLKLKQSYSDALKRYLPGYLCRDATFETPGGTVSGVSYYNAVYRNSNDFYYDDNAWVCIQLLLGYRNLGDKSLLDAAKENLDFLRTGWDDALGGGIYWSKSFESKNACSTAPVAIANLLYYQITGEEDYLQHAIELYDWMNAKMRENDLFVDNIVVSNGSVNRWKGAYNQGTMIYAGSMLFEITGEEKYYELTKKTVEATLPLMFAEETADDGSSSFTMRENPIFKSWCVGWLVRGYVRFFEADPEKDTTAMDRVNSVLKKELATKDKNGLYDPFFCSGGSDPEAYNELLSQAGVASVLLNAAYFNAVLR